MRGEQQDGAESIVPKLAKKEDSATPPTPSLDREAQARIGKQLRAMYDDLLRQPVPDRFTELLKKLDDETGRAP